MSFFEYILLLFVGIITLLRLCYLLLRFLVVPLVVLVCLKLLGVF